MITAQQAREILENKPFASIEEVFQQIKSRAEYGLDFTWFEDKRITDEDQNTLLELGYKIKEDIETHSFKITW